MMFSTFHLILAIAGVSITNADLHRELFAPENQAFNQKKEGPLHPVFGRTMKSLPKEDKAFKKPISPFLISEKTHPKVICQKTKQANNDESAVCYKCKDPKTGLNYEYCSEGTRFRRSNSEETSSESSEKPDYRFGKEYFLPQASRRIETKQKNKNCKRVMKDSMVCMICKDGKSNEQYEQCSYVAEPKDKAYAFSRSSSFGGPRDEEQSDSTAYKPVYVGRNWPTHQELRDESKDASSEEDNSRSSESSHVDSPSASSAISESKGCRKVRKKEQTCTVCKNPKTGANSETCFYEYQPPEKLYKFTKSKSFGYPESSSSSSREDDSSEKSESKPSSKYVNRSPKYEEEDDDYSSALTSDYEGEDEEGEESRPSNCKEVRKDDLICTVCKDPKTGGDSEKCAYSYVPDDKVYAYTKSRSFGNPVKERDEGSVEYDGDDDEESASESFQRRTDVPEEKERGFSSDASNPQPTRTSKVDIGHSDATKRKAEIEKFLQEFKTQDRSKCRKIERNEMTCYQCVNESGFRKEECMFVTAPEATENRPVVYNTRGKKVKREPSDSLASASGDSYVTMVRPDDSEKKSQEKEDAEATGEAEPYDTVSETKNVYNKVLGFSLPAYMLETSEAEAEFDKFFYRR